MAGRIPPDDSSTGSHPFRGPFSEPRSQRPRLRPRPYPTSLDTDLSLAAELRRSEDQAAGQRSLPNNLGWSSRASPQSSPGGATKKKGKHFEQVKLPPKSSTDSSPSGATQFAQKRHHTPHTVPRTRLPPGTPVAERFAMESLRQQLSFDEQPEPVDQSSRSKASRTSQNPSSITANNERTLPTQARSSASTTLPVLEMNETETTRASTEGAINSTSSKANTPMIIARLNQVRGFLKQATAMFITLQTTGVSEQRSSELNEQSTKIARLIRQLKQQERAYVELLERSVAVEHDSTLENTPSLSMHSLTEEEKSESASIRDEELQGLRQQHALLKKMLEQQQQLKELQTRQAALLTLQRDAEMRLAEAEEEGRHVPVEAEAVGGEEDAAVQGRGVMGMTQASSHLDTAPGRAGASLFSDDSRFTPEEQELINLLRMHKEKWRAADSGDEKDTDERENQRTKRTNQPLPTTTPQVVNPEASAETADNEEAALALANATQERLELENKLMVLEAKKEQMDTLLKELQSLKEAQLKKESMEASGVPSSSVNESKQEEDEPLATTSQKLDDERILEALEVHEKLKKLQEVRDRLNQLRELIGHYQPAQNETDRPENVPQTHPGTEQLSVPIQTSDEHEELEGAVGGAASGTDQDLNSIEWMLSAGVEDPDLMGKIRQLQEARARVAHLFKQTNESVQMSPSRVNNEAVQTQAPEEESEADTQTDTDAESAVSAGSSSVNAMAWQDDPEFQAKVRKLNSAKQKLKQLQELVKKIQQFPDSAPTLPAELAELSFDEDDFEDNDDEEEEDDEEDEEEEEERDESNRSETSDDNEGGDRQNEDEEVTTATEDEEAGDVDDDTVAVVATALKRNRLLELEGSDQEAMYQRYLQKQTEELEQLQQERQRLLEVQEELARMSQRTEVHKTVATQTREQPQKAESAGLHRHGTFTIGRSGVDLKRPIIHQPVNREISTQTPFYGSYLRAARSIDSSEPPRARPSALVWSELRRQRELHEEKLKKRKQKFLEKRKKAGLDDLSEGGTYSVRSGRSGDIDEGFGVSMMSADITTATWGGSTQPSSTQNDSAVSADESDEENQGAEIAVEVEDDYPDGIVQAEEEEEEQLEPEAFAGGAQAVFRSRERVPRMTAFRGSVDSASQPSSGKKRKLDGTAISGGARKRERERGLTFEDWPRTFYFDRNSRGRIRQGNFTPAEQLIKEREQEQFNMERHAWEQQCERLHQEVSTLTTLCNGLLRDQQMLVSTVIGRNVHSGPASSPGFHNIPGPVPSLGGNPFEQYQQRQQEAYQGLHNFFDQQRYMQQQHQILQSLNQCYSQLQQQHQDMATLQQQFQQLFTYNSPSVLGDSNPSSYRPQTATPSVMNNASPSFMSLPSHSIFQPPFSAPPISQASFTSAYQPPSSAPVFRTVWHPQFGQQPTAANEPPKTNEQASSSRINPIQESFNVNPDTGVPSPRTTVHRGHPVEPAPPPSSSGVANPVKVVREVGPSALGVGLSPGNIRQERKYDPSSYQELASTSANASKTDSSADVIGRTFNTPLRASAVANLAQKDKSAQKSTAFNLAQKLAAESVETSSRASSVPGDAQDVARASWQEADRVSEAGSEFSLFEALRDSIYSEVATLISLNESRPHFLLELFRELQLLTSDYLRQRALYALQDLVTRFLTEDSVGAEGGALQQARFQEWLGSNSELTPSETVETFEDDESETREAAVPAETVTEGIYDYVENVESGSTLSTPTSSHTGEPPFASEGLGDTVIHLDKALSRMREYERLRTEGKLSELVAGPSTAKDKLVKDDVTTSSAGDVGSESSISDVQYPRIDTQALDHLIKSIMSEVIPYLNEHMEDNCTSDLLGYIRNLVLSRIQVNEDQEFGRFFHKQLASILQDSLARFKDRKMKDVGEDMLVDMSEILFNELAFFRLMQDLDGNRGASQRPTWRQGFDSASTDTGTGQDGDKEDGDDTEEKEDNPPEDSAVEEEGVEAADEREEAEGEEEEEIDEEDEVSSEESSSSEESGAEDEGADDEGPEDEEEEEEEAAAAALPISKEQQEAEEENLGKARDDVMASQFEERPSSLPDNSIVDSPQKCVKLELSASESKPFSSFGSGEEDGEESFDDSDARRKIEEYQGSTAAAASASKDRGNNRDGPSDSDDNGAPQDEQRQAVEAAAEAAAAGMSGFLQNGQISNGQDDNEVTLDDLPTKLTGLTEADLQARIAEEQSRTEGSAGVLGHLDGLQELAGDPEALREPESSERPLNGLHGDPDK